MLVAVSFQIIAALFGGLIAWMFNDALAAKFFMFGGIAAVLPNALFALRLSKQKAKPAESYPVVFFLGALIKIVLTVGLFGLVIKTQTDIRWLPLILGLIIGLKAPLFALWFTGDRTTDLIVEAQRVKAQSAADNKAAEEASAAEIAAVEVPKTV